MTRTNSQRITVISAIGHDGYVGVRVLNPGQRFNRIVFADFLRHDIAPLLNPYNGRNARSVVVLGNKWFATNDSLHNKHLLKILFLIFVLYF